MKILRKPFYYIRHGETDWNRQAICMGSKDIPLNLLGIAQAESAANMLKTKRIDHIVTSPLSRATKTGEIIASHLKKPMTVIDDLKECCWGTQEAQPIDDGTLYQKWLKGESSEGSERICDFEARVVRGFRAALDRPGIVLMISHRGVYSAIQRILNWPLIKLKNCVPIYHRPLEYSKQSWFVCHLKSSK